MCVVVVVQTRCNDEMFIHDAARNAPNYGGRVPVDTTPGPVPVYRASKNPHSPCQSTATAKPSQFLHSEPPGICRCTQRACNNIVQARIRRAEAVGTRRFSHRLHPRNLLDLHTGTSNTLSMNCNWEITIVCKPGPWETTSASRQGCRRLVVAHNGCVNDLVHA